MTSQVALRQYIMNLSVDDYCDWNTVRQEWEVIHVRIKPGECPCGKEIMERCYIRNIHNDEVCYVGSKCVNQFGKDEYQVAKSLIANKKRKYRRMEEGKKPCCKRCYGRRKCVCYSVKHINCKYCHAKIINYKYVNHLHTRHLNEIHYERMADEKDLLDSLKTLEL